VDKRFYTTSILLLFLLLVTQSFHPDLYAHSAENVLLIINDRSPASREIAEYYKKMRNLPPENLCHLDCTEEEEIDRDTFNRELRDPIVQYLKQHGLQDKILYIVTTSGIPLKIKGTRGPQGDLASVDSELCMLYQYMLYGDYGLAGTVLNPYFAGNSPPSRLVYFNRKDFDIYLVTRLTAYTTKEAKALIRKSLKARPVGQFLIDDKPSNRSPAKGWMVEANDRMRHLGIDVIYDTTSNYITGAKNVMGYCSWGSNDGNCNGRFLEFKWRAGAITTTFVSTNARTFKEPPKDWQVGKKQDFTHYYAGSYQDLVGDLVRDGVTGSVGYVYEPYLTACAWPHLLFSAYVSGFNLAESYYMALPFLSWQSVVVGDPLCRPYEGANIAQKLN
jgi:uncharacterized protein (TIGR03790 family)